MTAEEPESPGTPAAEGAIVIGSDYIALGVVRSLGRHGIPVWVLRDLHACAAASRYARRCLPWPVNEDARHACLLELAARHELRGWTLFPTDDEAAALVARHHDSLSRHFRLTTPHWHIMQWAYDKRLTHALAERLSIDQPRTYFPKNVEAVAQLGCAFPAVLKPAVKSEVNEFTLARAWRVEDRQDLLARYREACQLINPALIMVQELIPGNGQAQLSFAALCTNGRTIASLVARRVRQYPLDFGRGSTFVETIDEPRLEQPARQLLAELRYSGLVELEFKLDPRDGRPKLLDINARPWGWHVIGARAGVDFPYLSWRLAHGEETEEVSAKVGIRWVRALTDVLAVAEEIRRGRLTARVYLRSLRPPLQCAVFALDDPLPAMIELPTLLHRSTSGGNLLRSLLAFRGRQKLRPTSVGR